MATARRFLATGGRWVGTPLVLGEREVGHVGSSVVSPRFGPIALALVRREASVGDELAAGSAVAVVAQLPFA